jgi:hypothetical protein
MPSEVNFYMEKLNEDMSYPVKILMILDSIYDELDDDILFKIIATDGTIGCESTLSKEHIKKVLESQYIDFIKDDKHYYYSCKTKKIYFLGLVKKND